MGGEERFCAEPFAVGAELEHRAGDAHAVEGRCAAADLVENEMCIRDSFSALRDEVTAESVRVQRAAGLIAELDTLCSLASRCV